MKRNYVIIIGFLLFSMNMNSQNIGINTDTPDNSALLELSSTDRGLLMPRMTTMQRDSIDLSGNPLSCLIFNTDSLCFQTYVGNEWRNLWCYEGDTSSKSCPATVTDYDGNVYNVVGICDQCWMQENLKVTHYPDGTLIPYVTDSADWADLADNNTDDAYCYYNNNTGGEASTYGALYTWAAAMGDNAVSSDANPSGVQGVCPDGWHLPSNSEWIELIDSCLGGQFVAAGKMKETGTTHWWSPNSDANNSSGFTALPGGQRQPDDVFQAKDFDDLGEDAHFWSSTEDITETDEAFYVVLFYNLSFLSRTHLPKSFGFSVRCVQD